MSVFKNEDEIISALDSKDFSDLNANLQEMVLKIDGNKIPKSITAKKYAGRDNVDLSVT